jgi:hypothetical protein
MRILLLASLILFAACDPQPKLKKTWTDPSVSSSTVSPFQENIICCFAKDASTRRMVEDRLVQQSGGRGVASHNFLQPGDSKENEKKWQKDEAKWI